jgi:tetratricopeptide (TPR) repeat protein
MEHCGELHSFGGGILRFTLVLFWLVVPSGMLRPEGGMHVRELPRAPRYELLYGQSTAQDLEAARIAWADTVYEDDIALALARRNLEDGRESKALEMCQDLLEAFPEGNVDPVPWSEKESRLRPRGAVMGHRPKPPPGEQFQDTWLAHFRLNPSKTRDVVRLLRSEILMRQRKSDDAIALLSDLIREHAEMELVAGDSALLAKILTGFGRRVAWAQLQPTRFFFRVGDPELPPYPKAIERPWRAARRLRAQAYMSQARWRKAADDLDIWLNHYGAFALFETQVESSVIRLECLRRIGDYEAHRREVRRGLAICRNWRRSVSDLGLRVAPVGQRSLIVGTEARTRHKRDVDDIVRRITDNIKEAIRKSERRIKELAEKPPANPAK